MRVSHDVELNLIRSTLDQQQFDATTLRAVKPDYFSDAQYQVVWEMILTHWQVYGKVPDLETVGDHFPDLTSLLVRARPVEPPAYYADALVESFVRYGVAQRLQEAAPKLTSDVKEALSEMRHIIGEYDLIENKATLDTMSALGRERLDMFRDGTPLGVPYPWPTLEHATLGAQKGELIGLIARPGSGKTHLTLRMAKTAWEDDRRVLIICTEVPAMNMLFRLDAQILGVDYDKFRKRMLSDVKTKEYEAFLLDTPNGENVYVADGMGLTPSALSVLVEQTKPDIVLVDGVYMMDSDQKYKEDWQKIRYLTADLKKMAQRYNVPVVFNSQFSRSVASAYGAKGKKNVTGGLEDIAYGDAIGHYADLVMAVGRSMEDIENELLSIRIIKGRETADGINWKVRFDFTTMLFDEIKWQDLVEGEGQEGGGQEVVW